MGIVSKKKHIVFVLALAVMLTIGLSIFSVVAHAASNNVAFVKSSWTRIYPAETNNLSTPINGQVRIDTFNYGSTHLDIRMLDRNGNVVWSECCAIDKDQSRTFNCGSNVYYIEAKSHWSGINLTDKKVQVTTVKRN